MGLNLPFKLICNEPLLITLPDLLKTCTNAIHNSHLRKVVSVLPPVSKSTYNVEFMIIAAR